MNYINKILKKLAHMLIRMYQLIISPLFPSSCRYEPTCSEYTRQAIEKYGAGKGTILGIRRISRCHPWSKGERWDPVV